MRPVEHIHLILSYATQQYDAKPITQTGRPLLVVHAILTVIQEIINARVCGGIHYREMGIKGVVLGRKVAHWTLQRYFLPEN